MKSTALLLPLLAFLAPALAAQDPGQRLTLQAAFEPEEAAPGDEVKLVIRGTIEPGWHIYGALDENPTIVHVDEAGGLEPVGEASVPPGELHEQFGIRNFWVEGQAEFVQRFTVPEGLDGGVTVEGRVEYMACTPEFCDPIAEAPFSAVLAVTGGGAGKAAQDPGTGEGEAAPEPGLQDPLAMGEGPRLTVTPRFEPEPARPGEQVTLVLEVEMEPGWHIYGGVPEVGEPTTLRVDEDVALERVGRLRQPEGIEHEAFGKTEHWLVGSFELRQDFVVPEDTEVGELPFRGELRYMACTETSCDPPGATPVELALAVEAGEIREAFVPTEAPVEGRGPQGALDAGGSDLWLRILLAIGGGLFALAMPCTYPMIPITISFFTKQADARGGRVLPLALAYGAGIVAMFMGIGLLVALALVSNATIQDFATSWGFNLIVGVAFVFFALVLFGMVDLRLPDWMMNAAGKASSKGGYIGVFLMGLTLVVTSFTCTAPIVGAILAEAAQTQDASNVMVSMGAFGLTMALPFVGLSLMPGRAKQMKSGAWMNTLKVFLGFVELAAALKFLSNVDIALGTYAFNRELFLLAWAGIFMLASLYLFGMLRGRDAVPSGVGPARMTGAIAVFGFSLYCLFGAMGFRLDLVMSSIVPPFSAPLAVAKGGEVETHEIVVDDHERALQEARSQGKLLLVNLTGFQ